DALILCTGVALQVALAAAERLGKAGVQAAVLHVPTVKPLDTEAIIAAAARVPAIVTVEEHTLMGGLGSAAAELLAESDLLAERRFKRVGLPDVFPSFYGDQSNMMKHYGISAENVADQVRVLLTPARGRLAPVSRAA